MCLHGSRSSYHRGACSLLDSAHRSVLLNRQKCLMSSWFALMFVYVHVCVIYGHLFNLVRYLQNEVDELMYVHGFTIHYMYAFLTPDVYTGTN